MTRAPSGPVSGPRTSGPHTSGPRTSGPLTPGPTRLAIESPAPGTRIIHLRGVLNSGTGARLLRLLDSQLTMSRSGHNRLDAVIVDVADVEALERGGPQALQHARYACARHGVEFALAGHPAGLLTASVALRSGLGHLRTFPTVDAALTVVGAGAGADDADRARPVLPVQRPAGREVR